MIDEPLNEMGLMRVQISSSLSLLPPSRLPSLAARETSGPVCPIIIIINDGISIRRSADSRERERERARREAEALYFPGVDIIRWRSGDDKDGEKFRAKSNLFRRF